MKNLLDYALKTQGKAQVKLRGYPNEILIFTIYNLNKNFLSRHKREFDNIINEHIQTFTITHKRDMTAIAQLEKEIKNNCITDESYIHLINRLQWQDLIEYLNEHNNSFKFLSWVDSDKFNNKHILDIVFNQLNILADRGIENILPEDKNLLIDNLNHFKNLFVHHRQYYTTKICQFLSFLAWEDSIAVQKKRSIHELFFLHCTIHFDSMSSDLFSLNYIIEKDPKNIYTMFAHDMNLYDLNEKSIKELAIICQREYLIANTAPPNECKNIFLKAFMLTRHSSLSSFEASDTHNAANINQAQYKKFLFTSLQYMKKDCIDLIDTDSKKIIISLYDNSTEKLKLYLEKNYPIVGAIVEKMKLDFLLDNQHNTKPLNKL